MNILIDRQTGRRGAYREWVEQFASIWSVGRTRYPEFERLLDPMIRLRAPGLRPTTGWAEARAAFERTFAVFPDLAASVDRWSAEDPALFIEMTFSATVGGRHMAWKNVDRFLFRDGVAIERLAFFNPSPLRRALLRSPRGWLQLLQHRRGSAERR